jgi:hypothetical protein
MSKHAKDWALTAAVPLLATTGLGAAGIGPLAGLLGGLGAAGEGAAAGAGLLGTGEALGMPLMGSVAAPMAETAMLAPPQLATSGGFMDTLGSSQFGNAMRGVSMANNMGGQQQQPQAAPMQMPQQQPQQSAPLYGIPPEEQRKRDLFSALGYLNG